MPFVNLTPHAINIVGDATVTIPPSGRIARVTSTSSPVGEVEGVPLHRTSFGAVEGLDDPQEGVVQIVSAMVRAALPGRTDLASPGDLVRDGAGQVIGCRGLIIN